MKINKLIISTFLCSSIFAASFDISDRVKSQNVLLSTYPAVFGGKDFAHKESFIEIVNDLKRRKKKPIIKIIKELDGVIPDKILRPLSYWKGLKSNNVKTADVLYYYMVYRLFILRDHIDNPLTNNKSEKNAISLLQELLDDGTLTTNTISKHFPDIREKAENLSSIKDLDDFVKAVGQEELISTDLKKMVPALPSYSLSALGVIPGNTVEIVSENKRGLDRIDWLNERVIFAGGKLDFDAPYVHMPTKEQPIGNIIFMEDPIYIKIREMIDSAEESIFIDIFLFGGTLGATLSEYMLDEIIKKKEKNPDFKALILHDYATNYNMVEEMLPIFQYIKKRITTEKELIGTVKLMQANIQRHPPGVPFNLTELIPKTPESFDHMKKGNTYYESKIDHSKVIVVDANSDEPEAYFGSKNWTDHSGGYYYDDAIYVKGPAAALVQQSYVRDIEAALTTDKFEMSRMYYQELGLDNKEYLKDRDQIIKDFTVTRKVFPYQGNSNLRIAEADVDGTIKNVRNMLIDMIANAQSHIYMEQLFLYDPYVVDALIKKKVKSPEVDIRLVLDHNGNFGMNGIPNTFFVKEMKENGIKIRARKTYGITANFPDGTTKEYHQENHRKISSVDGKVVLGGSSNINPDTLQGSFREFGAQIWDKKEVTAFEERFKRDWKDTEKMVDLDIENFHAKILGKLFDKRTSALINSLVSKIFRSKDKLEKRY